MAKWAKGQSGNPGGRPSGIGEIRDFARKHTDAAIQVLVNVMGDMKANPAARVGAATALLDRGWGRPAQTIISATDDSMVDAGLMGSIHDLLMDVKTKRLEKETKSKSEIKPENESENTRVSASQHSRSLSS